VRRALAVFGTAATLLLGGCHPDSRFIYHPQPTDEAAWRATAQTRYAEPVRIERDGAVLRGWLWRPPQRSGPLPAIVYFGGNAEDVSWMLAEAHRLDGHALLAVPYRGYGASTGVPGEAALYGDALAVHDWLAARPDIDAARIALWGRSLGTGVATWVAAHRPVAGVVLTTPFDSVAALAWHHLPALAFLVTQRFDSLSRAPSIDAPLLAFLAGADQVVPPAHGERLVAAWGGRVRALRLPQATHDDVHLHPGYWPEVAAFLATLPARAARTR
jgi:dienelactone hydrolase